ncbi:MAG TPA: DUF4058 family protein [Planctomycetaceae bacterium]
MPGPFPGMDPFLENHWGDVHTSLTTYARNQLQEQLPSDLRARVEESVSVTVEGEPPAHFKPDVRIAEGPRRTRTDEDGGVAVAEPVAADPFLVPLVDEPPTARSVQIVERSGGRVVTSIEFLSPHNKLTERAREQFRRKQELMLAGGVNLVEIDLVRQGGWGLSVREPQRPQPWSYPYRACVIRAVRPSLAECYSLPLAERLPVIRIPLRPTDEDVTLDLQRLIDAAWRDGGYEDVDRSREPLPPFEPQDSEWVRQRLREAAGPRPETA